METQVKIMKHHYLTSSIDCFHVFNICNWTIHQKIVQVSKQHWVAIYWQWEMTTRYEVTNECHNQQANNGLWHLFKNEKWIETQTGQKLTNTTKVYPKIHGQNKIVGHHIENQIWTSCIQSF